MLTAEKKIPPESSFYIPHAEKAIRANIALTVADKPMACGATESRKNCYCQTCKRKLFCLLISTFCKC